MKSKKLWSRDFTIMVIGQIISLFGNNLLRFALSVYTLRLTGSATMFGTVLALATIPTVILSPIGGILADRVSRRNIMVVLDFTTAAIVFISWFFLSGSLAVAAIIIVMVLLNIIQAFYNPAVSSSVPLLQDGDNVVRGNAVVSQVQALAGLVGPVLGGILSGVFGILPIVIVCAISFFISAVLELFLHIPFTPKESDKVVAIIKKDMKTSFRFMKNDQPDILRAMIVVAVFNFVFTPLLLVGLSVLIINILGLSDTLYGISYGMVFVGSMIGAILSGVLAKRLRADKLFIPLLICGLCVLPIAVGFLLNLPAMALFVVITVCCMAAMALASLFSIFALSFVQRRTPDTLLGQIMGYVMALSQCASPLGQLMYGVLFDALASRIYILLIGATALSVLVALASKNVFAHLGDPVPEMAGASDALPNSEGDPD